MAFPILGWAPLLQSQVLNFGDKLFDLAELSVDGGKSDVGYFVEHTQPDHDGFADRFGGNFPIVHLGEFADDIFNYSLDGFPADRTLFTSPFEPGEDLPFVEVLVMAVPFDDSDILAFNFFVGGESVAAIKAFPSPPDHGAILGCARVDDLVLDRPALRTPHRIALLHLINHNW